MHKNLHYFLNILGLFFVSSLTSQAQTPNYQYLLPNHSHLWEGASSVHPRILNGVSNSSAFSTPIEELQIQIQDASVLKALSKSPNEDPTISERHAAQTKARNLPISHAAQGVLTDSALDRASYRKNEDFIYTIAPVNASSISLQFSKFNLETNSDFLYIYDGSTTAAPLIAIYTSNKIPPVTTSSGASLTLRFAADFSTQNLGWEANWTSSNIQATYPDPILLNSSMTGDLNCGLSYHDFYDSGNATGMYANNENNIQTFCNPDPTKAIRLSFQPNPTAAQQLSLSSRATGNDYLYLYNGADTTANLVGLFTGGSATAPQPGTFVSSGACLTVKMNSDATSVGNGWIARLYCSDPPTNLGVVEVGGIEGTKPFTDLGGTTSNYANNENYIVTYCPHATAPSSDVVWAEFSSNVGLESNWDYLYVFDGTDTENGRLICAYTGSAVNNNTLETIKASIENSSGCLTFQFFSDGATTASGWSANIYTGAARLAYGAEDCSNATFVGQTGKDYAGSTSLATGSPGSNDPALNISIGSLPECSGANTITRLENSIWYRFITPDALCIPSSFNIDLNNISCSGEGTGGSGIQFILYEVDNCQSGATWPAPIYCADKLVNGSSVDIKNILKPSQNYYLMIDGFAGQNCNLDLRFSVTTNGNTNSCFLPLDLLSFAGQKQESTNLLRWSTANEENVFGFFVQRRNPISYTFEEIGFIPSINQTGQTMGNYIFEDANYTRNAVNYYRLRQVDNDGLQSYSPIVSIDNRTNASDLLLKVYPNPTKDLLFFSVQSETNESYKLILYDRTGREIYQQKGVVLEGYWNEQFSTQQLAAGLYLYHLTIGKQTLSGKFEKL